MSALVHVLRTLILANNRSLTLASNPGLFFSSFGVFCYNIGSKLYLDLLLSQNLRYQGINCKVRDTGAHKQSQGKDHAAEDTMRHYMENGEFLILKTFSKI